MGTDLRPRPGNWPDNSICRKANTSYCLNLNLEMARPTKTTGLEAGYRYGFQGNSQRETTRVIRSLWMALRGALRGSTD